MSGLHHPRIRPLSSARPPTLTATIIAPALRARCRSAPSACLPAVTSGAALIVSCRSTRRMARGEESENRIALRSSHVAAILAARRRRRRRCFRIAYRYLCCLFSFESLFAFCFLFFSPLQSRLHTCVLLLLNSFSHTLDRRLCTISTLSFLEKQISRYS